MNEERLIGVDPDGYEVAETRTGQRWGPLHVTRLASDKRYGVGLEVATEAGSVEVHASPSGQSMTVEVRQVDLDDRRRTRLLHHWRLRGRGRSRRVTPEPDDETTTTGDPDER